MKRKWTVLGLQLGSLRRQLQRKRHFKLKKNFALGQVCCDFHMLVALDKIGGVCLRLPCTKTIRVEAKNERFIAACWRSVVVRTSNMKISRRRLGDYVKKSAPKSVPQVQQEYFSES